MKFDEYQYDEDKIPNKFPNSLFKSLLTAADSLDFYGVDNNTFCVGVNGSKIVLEAVENPDDGYRSYFGCWRTDEVGKIFFRDPIARVRIVEVGDHVVNSSVSGWQMKDVADGHVWLEVGTDYSDDYYPCFIFTYNPKRNGIQ